MFISISAAAELLGVSHVTLRRWEKEGFLAPSFRTKGNHRRYRVSDLLALFSLVSVREWKADWEGVAHFSDDILDKFYDLFVTAQRKSWA